MIRKKYLSAVSAAMAVSAMFGLFGCTKKDDGGNPIASSNKEISYKVENLLDTADWLTKSAEDVGIPAEYTENTGVKVDGLLLGADAYGTAYRQKNDDGEFVFNNISLFCSDLTLNEATAKLNDLYGRPYDEGEEPYVESNGGAVTWQRFYTGTATIQISKADNYDYCHFDITYGGFDDDYTWKISSIGEATGYTIDFDSLGLNDINCHHDTYTGTDIYGISYTYNGVRYDVDIVTGCDVLPENYRRYALISPNTFTADKVIAGDDSNWRISDSLSGAIMWHENILGNIWVLYMPENCTRDALITMKNMIQGAVSVNF